MDVKFYLSLFLRRLPWFVLLVAIGTALGLTLASVLPPVYVAQARLLVESEQIPDNLAASTVQTGATEQLQIIQQRILTRAELLELANRLQVYAPVDGRPARQMAADDIVSDMRKRVRIQTSGGGSSRGPAQARFVTVSFEAPTAALSAAVANELVTMILDQNVALRTGAASQTLEFFNQEVERLDRDLATKGDEILRFKMQNMSAMPDSLDFRRNQQAAEQERLVRLEREETALKDRRQRLVTLYETTGTIETPTENLSPAQKQLQRLRDQLAEALFVYAPQNPRVRVLQAQVAAAERVVAAEVGAGAGANAPSAFEVQMADIDGQLAFMAEEKARIEKKLEVLNSSIEATPANALALGSLDRDFSNLRSQYDQAVASRARAETGDLIETLSKGQRISVIEQAVVPREPARPNRMVIAAGGVGGGLAFGLAFVVLLELMNRAIRRPVDLTKRLGITPFTTLPYMRTRGESRRRSLIIAVALLVVLVGIPVGLWAVDTYYLPIDMIIDRLIDRLGLTDLVAQTRQSLGQGPVQNPGQ